ncbi:MAG: hypothetical protein ACRCYC_10380 [Paraclostridium sp.]|uniref:hypothetical protein n=1 Tax=Paraclostridium sp. TaxID=2023273 RepID=UPI003F35851D
MLEHIININTLNKISYLDDITETFDFLDKIDFISDVSVDLDFLSSNLVKSKISRDYSNKLYSNYLFAINFKIYISAKYISKNNLSIFSLKSFNPIYKTIEIFLPQKLNNISTVDIIKKQKYFLEYNVKNIYFRMVQNNLLLVSIIIEVKFKY